MSDSLRLYARRLSLSLAGSLGVASLIASPAEACHGMVPVPDNADQWVHRNGLTSGGNTATDWGKAAIDASNITTHEGSSAGDDIQSYDHSFAGGSYAVYNGYYNCPTYGPYPTCDIWSVHFNTDAGVNASDADWKWAGCHEFGHTGGLNERANSCDSDQNSCMVNSVGNGRRSLDNHDIATINGNLA